MLALRPTIIAVLLSISAAAPAAQDSLARVEFEGVCIKRNTNESPGNNIRVVIDRIERPSED